MKEREAKLDAPPGFELPELGGADDGFSAEPLAPRRLRTTYYDTADLRLARWGASLRWRPGEGWTVKLPEGQDGVLLVRAEHVFPGDGRRPPAEALSLIRPFVRTAQLSPSVRMRTLRRPVELRDPRRVAARRGGRRRGPGAGRPPHPGPLPRARGRAGRGGRRRPARAGGATGWSRPAPWPPSRPPSTCAPSAAASGCSGPRWSQPEVDAGASVEALLRHDLAGGTLRLFRHEAGVRTGEDPEAVHQARVATRRIRSTLRTFSKLLDEEWTDRLRDDLKWLADLLGEVRDTDVLLERFSGHLDALPAADAKAGRRLLARLAEQRDQARRRLLGGHGPGEVRRAARRPGRRRGRAGPAPRGRPPGRRGDAAAGRASRGRSCARRSATRATTRPTTSSTRSASGPSGPATPPRRSSRRSASRPRTSPTPWPTSRASSATTRTRSSARPGSARPPPTARRDVALVAGLLIAAERASAAATRDRWRPVWKAANRKQLRAWLP